MYSKIQSTSLTVLSVSCYVNMMSVLTIGQLINARVCINITISQYTEQVHQPLKSLLLPTITPVSHWPIFYSFTYAMSWIHGKWNHTVH